MEKVADALCGYLHTGIRNVASLFIGKNVFVIASGKRLGTRFLQIKINKSLSPDGINPRVLKELKCEITDFFYLIRQVGGKP